MSWAGKILRVNLSAGTVKSEPLNREWAQAYIGSRGLGTKYLVEEVDAKVDPLSPDNKIIWATGPLTGTMASTGGRYTVITKGPLTGAIACSNSGGYWGAEFKMAGWDMVIFEGKSAKPVYLYVNDDVAELRDAAHLWGKSVWETEEMIKKGLQDPLARVSSIGKAGENGVLFAAVVNDLHRAAGRSGVGAVMGSKNLKAIAVRGTKGVGNIKDPKAFMAATKAAKKVLADNGVTGTGLPAMGTQVLMGVINEVGGLPTRNHQDNQFEGAMDIGAEAMAKPRATDGKKQLVTNQACLVAPSPAGASARWTKATSPSRTSRNTAVPTAASNTKPPGHSAPPMASTTWNACNTPTCCATKKASTRSASAPPWARSWSSTAWAC
jgi:aldehyde:ferredoxin oxidoreductase